MTKEEHYYHAALALDEAWLAIDRAHSALLRASCLGYNEEERTMHRRLNDAMEFADRVGHICYRRAEACRQVKA